MESNRRVLIVDDQEDLRQQVARILEPKPGSSNTSSLIEQIRSKISKNKTTASTGSVDIEYAVDTVGQGRDAYEMVKDSFSDHRPYALMFLDMRMPPGWDGLETAQRIRAIDKEIQIVIMTAYADHEQREIAEKIGEPDKLLYIKKPFHPEEIRQLAMAMTEKWNMNRREKDRLILTNRLMRENSILSRHRFKNLKESYRMVLDAFVSFLDARCGSLVLKGEPDESVAATNLDDGKRMLKSMPNEFSNASQIMFSEKEGAAYFPITSDNFDGYVYIEGKNLLYSFEQLRSFLDILIETAREVLTNAYLHQQQSVEKQLAAVGLATGKISSRFRDAVVQIQALTEEFPKADTPQARDDLAAKINQVTDTIVRLTDEIGIFSDDQSRTLQIEKNKVKEMVADALTPFEDLLGMTNIQVEVETADDLVISCDKKAIENIMRNLITNSIEAVNRHNPEIKELKISASYLNSFRNAVSISIKDNGGGIDEEIIGRVYEPFVSIIPDEKNGLGVTLAKQLIDRHNGKLVYSTEPNVGTEFQIVLPISPDTKITGNVSGKLVN